MTGATDPTLDQAKAVIGMPGAGKSYTARKDVEQLLEERRHVAIIDPTGVWYGLRSNAAGTGPGFDIPIFGGEHGDVPITPADGAAIAGIIADQRVSAIVDLSLIHDSADQRDFMDAFVARLRSKPRGNFHLILDEAHEFAPEQLPDKESHRLRENITWLQKSGRVRGFVLTLITQRPADIAKRILNLSQTLVAHQLMAPGDQKTVSDYLKANASAETRDRVMTSLAELGVGERWIYSPRAKLLERGVTAPIATFDSMFTPAPGETKLEPRTLAQLDVSKIRNALASPPAREGVILPPNSIYIGAGLSAEDLKRLRAELKQSVTTGEYRQLVFEAAPDAAAITALKAELAGERNARIDAEERADFAAGLLRSIRALIDSRLSNDELRDKILAAGRAAPLNSGKEAAGGEIKPPSPAATDPDPTVGRVAAGGPLEDRQPAAHITGGRRAGKTAALETSADAGDRAQGAAMRGRKALVALAQIYPARLTEPQWATLAGYAKKGGTWGTYKGQLRSAGLVDLQGVLWGATKAGLTAAGVAAAPLPAVGPALARFWAERVPGARKLVDVLIKRSPHFTTRESLAADVGMSAAGGTFSTYLGRLRANHLLDEQGKKLRLAPTIMGGK